MQDLCDMLIHLTPPSIEHKGVGAGTQSLPAAPPSVALRGGKHSLGQHSRPRPHAQNLAA